MGMQGIDSLISNLRRALDVSATRNRVIAENIANAQTPGYKSRMIDFQKSMESAEKSGKISMSSTSRNHISSSMEAGGIEIERSGRQARADGNNVDQDVEMTSLAENTLIYRTASEILSRNLKMLRIAIEEGGK